MSAVEEESDEDDAGEKVVEVKTHKFQSVKKDLMEVETELKTVKSDNIKLVETINKQKHSLEQAANKFKAQQQTTAELATRLTVTERELHATKSALQVRSETDESGTVGELEKQLTETRELLNKTTEELSGTRQRLSDVQERLTVTEQVTAATQQRALQELQESGNSEEQQLELTPHHQLTTRTGTVLTY